MKESETSPRRSKTVLLAGIGGDAHSVGLNLLRRALARAGFQVIYLGTQNSVESVGRQSVGVDAVLISNMDGHAKHYLADVDHPIPSGTAAVWYLGGNPSTELSADMEYLTRVGFKRIFSGYVSPLQVVRTLDKDLGTAAEAFTPPSFVEESTNRWGMRRRSPILGHMVKPTFLDDREEVLGNWPTGDTARDLARNAERLRGVPSLAAAQDVARQSGRLLLHPRCGVGTVQGQARVFATLQDAGADVLSFQIDSLTRNNLYPSAQKALDQAQLDENGQGSLNGFPAVNHGAEAIYELVQLSKGIPFQVRHSTRDPRLLAEIAFAGAVTSFEGGAICYNLPYYRDYDPEEAIHAWRYVDLLSGHYQRVHGVAVDREFFGTLTAALVPPCIAIASCILEALMAADAGVRSLSLGYAEQGNRNQDIAAIRAMKALAREYLLRYGHEDVQISTVFHQYMCAFPRDPHLATQLLLGSTETAVASGATRMMLKTRVEAVQIPSAEENAHCVRLMRSQLSELHTGSIARQVEATKFEFELILKEVRAILDASLVAGEGDVHRATIAAIAKGFLDIPFSPSVWNAGKAITIRDSNGAVRFAEFGNVPLRKEVRRIHTTLVEQRMRESSVGIEDLIAEDIVSITDGRIDGWPLDLRRGAKFLQDKESTCPVITGLN